MSLRLKRAFAARGGLALVAIAGVAVNLGRGPARAEVHHGRATHDVAAAMTVDDTFVSMMAEAMRRMDAGMNVSPTGDPDRDFARMMIPHHQGAVDMALAELRFGKDERVRRLAQGIIVEQNQEIALMRSILNGETPSNTPTR